MGRSSKSTFPLTAIQLSIACCDECPKCKSQHTPGTGFGTDYICTAVKPNKTVMGYIEWDSEKVPVPDWCPLRVK